jgi:hypothetical protein
MPPAKKAASETHELTASWSVPLIPCPLVQPPASRAPKAISAPPQKPTAVRSTQLSAPKRSAHIDGRYRPVSSPPVQAATNPPATVASTNTRPQFRAGGCSR